LNADKSNGGVASLVVLPFAEGLTGVAAFTGIAIGCGAKATVRFTHR
jgi:hypothetical protein